MRLLAGTAGQQYQRQQTPTPGKAESFPPRAGWHVAAWIIGQGLLIVIAVLILYVGVEQSESVISELLYRTDDLPYGFTIERIGDGKEHNLQALQTDLSSLVVPTSTQSPRPSSTTTSAAPTQTNVPANLPKLSQNLIVRPVLDSNFADPSLIHVNGTFYSFATSNGTYHAQCAYSTNLLNWTWGGFDALPKVGQWVASADEDRVAAHRVWAPDCHQLPNDKGFVLWISAVAKEDRTKHCIGAAISPNVTGPYVAVNTSLSCPLSQGGAIDPSAFRDPDDGREWVVYKVDGNAVALRNSRRALSTPIMLQEVSQEDGYTRVGRAIQIFDRENSDDHLVENPNIHKANGKYYLLLSSGNFANGE